MRLQGIGDFAQRDPKAIRWGAAGIREGSAAAGGSGNSVQRSRRSESPGRMVRAPYLRRLTSTIHEYRARRTEPRARQIEPRARQNEHRASQIKPRARQNEPRARRSKPRARRSKHRARRSKPPWPGTTTVLGLGWCIFRGFLLASPLPTVESMKSQLRTRIPGARSAAWIFSAGPRRQGGSADVRSQRPARQGHPP